MRQIWFAVLAITAVTGFDRAAPAQVTATADQATLVVLAPRGPVFVDLRVSVAKLPYRVWIGRFLAKQLDGNSDGSLSETELKLIPPRLLQMIQMASTEAALTAAREVHPGETMATAKFAEWFSSRLPEAFDLIAQPQSADDAVRLSSLIDADNNATVSKEELASATRMLRFRDLDDDETWSVSELVPYRDPRSQQAAVTPDVVSLPFFYVTDSDSASVAAERIIARYGSTGTVSPSVLRQSATSSNAAEEVPLVIADVVNIVSKPDWHLTLDVRLADNAGISSAVAKIEAAAESFCSIRDASRGEVTLLLDGLPLKVVARGGGRNNRMAARGFIGQTFVMIDADRNQYLDEAEFPGIVSAMASAGASGDFAAVDLNGDKMVTRDELFGFADREQTAIASRIEVMVMQDGKTLFGLLDGNSDRRLSARELRSGESVLSRYDLDADGRFAETELGTEYVLTLGLGRSEMRRTSGQNQMMGGMMMNSGDAILSGTESLKGPEWYKRMDRNQDGDVSRREFIGTSAQFQTLDSDDDGLVNDVEADTIQATEPQ